MFHKQFLFDSSKYHNTSTAHKFSLGCFFHCERIYFSRETCTHYFTVLKPVVSFHFQIFVSCRSCSVVPCYIYIYIYIYICGAVGVFVHVSTTIKVHE